jgi:hypothetical protein
MSDTRPRQPNIPRIRSMVSSAKTKAEVINHLPLDENTALVIFPTLYESIRQLGDALLWLEGKEPLNHDVSMRTLASLDIKNKLLLHKLDRFRRIRNDSNYRGFKVTTENAKDIREFWDKCSGEIIEMIEGRIK